MKILQATNISKEYINWFSRTDVLKCISFDVYKNEALGIIGPNGAGKTTLMLLMLNLITPSEGEINFFPDDGTELNFSAQIGYMPEGLPKDAPYTVKSFLFFMGRLNRLPRKKLKAGIRRLLREFELDEWDIYKIKNLSRGMRQKLNLIQAILNDPAILFLDEPLAGLDPKYQMFIKSYLKNLQEAGKTLIINSHRLDFINDVCDRVLFLDDGKIGDVLTKEEGDFTSETNQIHHNLITYSIDLGNEELEKIQLQEYCEMIIDQGDKNYLFEFKDHEQFNSLLGYLRDSDIEIKSINRINKNLEEKFVDPKE